MDANEIKKDIETAAALIKKYKAEKSPTGQLQLAIGGLGQFIEFANHHLNLPPTPAPATSAQPKA